MFIIIFLSDADGKRWPTVEPDSVARASTLPIHTDLPVRYAIYIYVQCVYRTGRGGRGGQHVTLRLQRPVHAHGLGIAPDSRDCVDTLRDGRFTPEYQSRGQTNGVTYGDCRMQSSLMTAGREGGRKNVCA